MICRRLIITALAAIVATCLVPSARAQFSCASDVDGSGIVDVLDLLEVIAQWGPCPSCSGDVNGDDVVDVLDLLQVIGDWGPCLFDYGEPRPNAEAEQIGLEMLGVGGPLLVPDAIYERIERDQAAIRDPLQAPELADQIHSPAWLATDLIVCKVPGEPMEEYDALNVYFQLVEEDHLFGDIYVLTFPGNLNIPALVTIYAQLDAIAWAEPNGIIGGQNFWTPTDLGGGLWHWDVDDGWQDCFDGCDCHRVYSIQVDAAGVVTILDIQEWGQPWCVF